MRIAAIGIHRHKSRLRQQAAAMLSAIQCDALESVASHIRQTAMHRQTFVGHHVVGMNKIEHTFIMPQHFMKERDRFFLHGFFELRFRVLQRQEVQQLHIEPLMDELFRKPFRSRILQHAINLLTKDDCIGKFSTGGTLPQRVVRNTTPQKQRQP